MCVDDARAGTSGSAASCGRTSRSGTGARTASRRTDTRRSAAAGCRSAPSGRPRGWRTARGSWWPWRCAAAGSAGTGNDADAGDTSHLGRRADA